MGSRSRGPRWLRVAILETILSSQAVVGETFGVDQVFQLEGVLDNQSDTSLDNLDSSVLTSQARGTVDRSIALPPQVRHPPWSELAAASELPVDEPSSAAGSPHGAEDSSGWLELLRDTPAQKPDPLPHPIKRFFPPSALDVITMVLAALGLALAAAGGIGGGGILVPLYIMGFQFDPKHAIPLSNVTILGGSIANTILNVKKVHPLRKVGPVIDWDLVLAMEPLTIAGAVLGSFVNKMLPPLVLTISLAVILSLMGWKTLTKGHGMWNVETQKISQKTAGGPYFGNGNGGPANEPATVAKRLSDSNVEMGSLTVATSVALKDILEREHSTPWRKIIAISFCFTGTVVLTILKGGDSFQPLGVECGTPLFWFLSLLVLPWVCSFAFYFRKWLLAEYHIRRHAGYHFLEEDIQWNETATIRYPAICSMAGMVAGLFGVGGGIVKGPLMLEMGVQPQVASATAATMILFTASSATISYYTFGDIVPDYSVVMFVVGFCCTYAGQVGVSAYMKKQDRQSPIVIAIGVVVLISALMVVISTLSTGFQKGWGPLLAAGGVCSAYGID